MHFSPGVSASWTTYTRPVGSCQSFHESWSLICRKPRVSAAVNRWPNRLSGRPGFTGGVGADGSKRGGVGAGGGRRDGAEREQEAEVRAEEEQAEEVVGVVFNHATEFGQVRAGIL